MILFKHKYRKEAEKWIKWYEYKVRASITEIEKAYYKGKRDELQSILNNHLQ